MKLKHLKKATTFTLALMLSLSATACFGGGGGGEGSGSGATSEVNRPVNESKTQLTVGVYEGGLGQAWARKVADNFEAKFAETSFEAGKTGVEVTVASYPEQTYGGAFLTANIQSGLVQTDVIYTATRWSTFEDDGIALDITDTLDEKVYDADGNYVGEESGSLSILDRMDDYFVDSYKDENDKYHAFPFEDTVMGIVYDEDLFVEKGWKLPSEMTNISEFYPVVKQIVGSTMTPFVIYNDAGYYSSITNMVTAQYEGYDQARLNDTFNGVATFPAGTFSADEVTANGVTVAADGTQSVTITPANAWMLARQQGKKEALKFLEQITYAKATFDPMSFKNSSHLDVQQKFVKSATNSPRIAMLIDGDWWENQARTTINSMGIDNPNYGWGKRNFKMMTLPTITGQKTDKKVLYGWSGGSAAFINANAGTAQQAAGKAWIQFMHGRESLAIFTTETGSVLPYDYDLTGVAENVEGEYDTLTPFAKSVYDLRRDENVQIYRGSAVCEFKKYNSTARVPGMAAKFGASTRKSALYEFYYNTTGSDVDTIWAEHIATGNATKANWDEMYANAVK